MHLSPFFHNLRSAYQAELDDLRHDSEGQFVLDRRLAQRRGEIEFLVNMPGSLGRRCSRGLASLVRELALREKCRNLSCFWRFSK